jgi:hypothetical protein
MKKSWFLLIALVLPVSIFFFLKFYGKNNFDLPLLIQHNTEWPIDCPQPEKFPFEANLKMNNPRKQQLLIFDTLSLESNKRLPVEIDSAYTAIIQLKDRNSPDEFLNCLVAKQGYHAVLVDTLGQIRGLYKDLNRDETDRVIMETKILSGKY